MDKRAQGVLFFKINGQPYPAKGSFNYNLGMPKREFISGLTGGHGYKESFPNPAFIEGDITVDGGVPLKHLLAITDQTIMLELRNGKVITLLNSWVNSDGTMETEEGKLHVRFESDQPAEESLNKG